MVAASNRGDAGLGYDFVVEVRHVRGALLRYAHRLTGSEAARDDLVQDTLLRAWAARHRFTAGTSFKAWLFRIARNSFLSGLRHQNRQVDLSDDAIGDMLTVPASQESELHLQDFQAAVAKLPPPQAEALLAVGGAQDRYEAVAQRLGIPEGTLRSRVYRARQAVADLMDRPSAWDVSTPAPANDVDGDVLAAGKHRPAYAAWKASGSRMIG
jgi:RNA polymerase sigma-70 factor (ECF subfamily)